MKSLRLALLPLLLGLLAFAGCSMGVKIAGTAVTVTGLKSGDGGQPQLAIRIANENIFSLAISKTEHRLYLNGQYAGMAESDVPVGIPSLSAAEKTLALKIDNSPVLGQLRGQKGVTYKLDTVVRMAVSEEDMKHTTSSTGTIDIPADILPAAK